MKILCVPDIHGRDFWIEPCQNWQGSIVFLGDYHDPYPEEVSIKDSLENLKKLVEFVVKNKNRCTCLIGNHDAGYLEGNRGRFTCRHDNRHHLEIQKLFKKLDLQLIKIVDPNVIFSHSGILPKWLEDSAIPNFYDVEFLDISNIAFQAISPYRGGVACEVGSCLFGDVREYDTYPHIPDYYQIFGHTQLEHEYITPDYACLDCRKCFIVDTETKEIIPYNK